MFAELLREDEKVEKLDLSGWIVLRHLIGASDEIVIRHDGIHRLFDRPVRAVVRGVSSNNLVAIDLITEGAKDRNGHVWSQQIDGWLDIAHDIYLVIQNRDAYNIMVVRGDNKPWMMQGPFTITVERETESHWFGYSADAPFKCRVWSKAEWRCDKA